MTHADYLRRRRDATIASPLAGVNPHSATLRNQETRAELVANEVSKRGARVREQGVK